MAHANLEQRILQVTRNDRLVDPWSFLHFAVGVLLGWIMDPFWALAFLILWEPLEINLLSRLSLHYLDIEFGFETWRNAMSDIIFDLLGVAFGVYLLRMMAPPPFVLL